MTRRNGQSDCLLVVSTTVKVWGGTYRFFLSQYVPLDLFSVDGDILEYPVSLPLPLSDLHLSMNRFHLFLRSRFLGRGGEEVFIQNHLRETKFTSILILVPEGSHGPKN